MSVSFIKLSMEEVVHFISDSAFTEEKGIYVLFTWCGQHSTYDKQLNLTKNAYKVTCKECKEESAMEMLRKAAEREV